MVRLTRRDRYGYAYPVGRKADKSYMAKVWERLASYEDTELNPDRIREVDEMYLEKCKEINELKKEISYLQEQTKTNI